MSDLADHAAATAAGYQRVQVDRGASFTGNRYLSRYEKMHTGAAGDSGYLLKADGESNVSQAAADTQALAALNGQRKLRYGAGAAAGSSGKGQPHTFDVT
jgi:hypothetical protein